MPRSTPGRPSQNRRNEAAAEREKKAILGKIKKDTDSGKRMSPRDIADAAEAARKQGEANQKKRMENG